MEMQQLRCALEVLNQGSFTKAAEKLYISQPSLSLHIKKLEKELGVALFIRTTHSIEPTEAGIEFCKCVQDVISAWDKLEICRKAVASTLTIGVLDRFKTINLPLVISMFHLSHPSLKIRVKTYNEDDLLKKLDEDNLDIVFLRWSMMNQIVADPAFKCELFFKEPVEVLMSKTNPLTKYDIINAEQLKGFELIVGNKDSITYTCVCNALNISDPEEAFSHVFTDNHDIMAELMRSGKAVSLGSKSLGDYYGLASVPFDPVTYNDAYMVYPSRKAISPQLELFIRFIKDTYSGNDWRTYSAATVL